MNELMHQSVNQLINIFIAIKYNKTYVCSPPCVVKLHSIRRFFINKVSHSEISLLFVAYLCPYYDMASMFVRNVANQVSLLLCIRVHLLNLNTF